MNEHFAIIWGTRRIVRSQLDQYLASAIKQLKGIGIESGDRVVICEENSVEYIVLIWALWQMRVAIAPVSPRWPQKTVTAYASKIGAAHTFQGSDIKSLVCFDAKQQILPEQKQELDLNQEATIIATSGSSGEPKPAVHTWGNHYYSAKGSQEIIPLTSNDRWLLSLPLYHVAGIGILVRCLLSGAGIVVVTDGDLAKALERSKVTHVSLVATQLHRLLADEHNHELLRSLKYILLGGSAIPRSLIEQSLKLGLNIYLSYGLTEMSSQVATGKVMHVDRPCAKTLSFRELRIAEDGEVHVKGETLFKGYIGGTRLQLPLTADGWFKTGDLGSIDTEGHLTILGRRDSMFISGGENIQPEEIEKALLSIAGISEAMVVPKEDKEFGFRPVAFIKYSGIPIAESQLIERLQGDLPRFKIPIHFYPWPQELIAQGLKISRKDLIMRL